MISEQAAKECIQRLTLLRFLPTNSGGLAELVRMLRDRCSDDDLARQVVDLMLERNNEWPGPAALLEAIEQVKRTREVARVKEVRRQETAEHEKKCEGCQIETHSEVVDGETVTHVLGSWCSFKPSIEIPRDYYCTEVGCPKSERIRRDDPGLLDRLIMAEVDRHAGALTYDAFRQSYPFDWKNGRHRVRG